MRTSLAGIRMIGNFEGLRLSAYKPVPSEKWWTIGYGHYGPDVRPGQIITKRQAEELLRRDLFTAEYRVNQALGVAGFHVNQNQFDALVSLVFNTGPGVLDRGRSLGDAIRAKSHRRVQLAFPLYVKGGQPLRTLPGLVRRRAAELKLYRTPALPPKPSRKRKRKMTTKQVQAALRSIGWPLKVDGKNGPETKRAIRAFQHGYLGFGGEFTKHPLEVDGVAGPRTQRALAYCVKKNGYASPHFAFAEFADHVTGWIETNRHLLRGLEKLRKTTGPIGLWSGYRDPKRGIGARNSLHGFGAAADPKPWLNLSAQYIARLGVFSGIGYDPTTRRVRHVDVRGYDGAPNPTGSTKANPAIFPDAY